jgi:Endosomal/lysosomal potassium channel TMEM175
VVAIAMTLLAIDLPVPAGGTVSAFWTSFWHDDGHYVAFLISFAVIAAAWTDHRDLFGYVTSTDRRTGLYNMGWLLTIVLNPFATRMLIVSGQSIATPAPASTPSGVSTASVADSAPISPSSANRRRRPSAEVYLNQFHGSASRDSFSSSAARSASRTARSLTRVTRAA